MMFEWYGALLDHWILQAIVVKCMTIDVCGVSNNATNIVTSKFDNCITSTDSKSRIKGLFKDITQNPPLQSVDLHTRSLEEPYCTIACVASHARCSSGQHLRRVISLTYHAPYDFIISSIINCSFLAGIASNGVQLLKRF